MADARLLATLSDDALGRALGEVGADLAAPPVTVNGFDAAARSRILIQWLQARERGETLPPPTFAPAGEPQPTPTLAPVREARPAPRVEPLLRPRPAPRVEPLRPSRSFRRSLVLAVAAVLVVAAIVGAVGLGLPGLRIIGATPSPALASPSGGVSASPLVTPSPTTQPSPRGSVAPGPPGSGLGLGVETTLADARQRSSFPVILPTDPRLGPPDTVWVDDVGRVTLIWTDRPGLPDTIVPGLSVIVSEFPGSIKPEYFEKILGQGTTIEPSRVHDAAGFWISGAPHDFVYVMPNGEAAYDSRRKAGDTLAWSNGGVTYRMETGLGQDSTIALAAGMR